MDAMIDTRINCTVYVIDGCGFVTTPLHLFLMGLGYAFMLVFVLAAVLWLINR